MRTEHILIIRFSALGDVAMLTPVVWSLAKQYPDVRITVLSKPFARFLFENLASNVSFMGADIKGEYHGIKGLNDLYRRLVAKKFTAIADMHNVLRSDYLRLRFNFDQYKVAHLYKDRIARHRITSYNNKKLTPLPRIFDNYCEVLSKLGYPITLDFKSIFPDGGGDLSIISDKIPFSKDNGKWIGIAPFAAHKAKILPLDTMENVISTLSEHHTNIRFFLFGGGKNEMDVFNNWTEKYTTCFNASGNLNGIQEELILMSHLNVMLSMDSGNMHLASLTGIPVVSVWGATHPFTGFMGYNQSLDNAIQLDLPCRPCSIYGNKKCRRNDLACINNIKAEDIINKIEDIIK